MRLFPWELVRKNLWNSNIPGSKSDSKMPGENPICIAAAPSVDQPKTVHRLRQFDSSGKKPDNGAELRRKSWHQIHRIFSLAKTTVLTIFAERISSSAVYPRLCISSYPRLADCPSRAKLDWTEASKFRRSKMVLKSARQRHTKSYSRGGLRCYLASKANIPFHWQSYKTNQVKATKVNVMN